MQIEYPRVKSHPSLKVNDTLPAEARECLRRLELFRTLRGEGCSEAIVLAAIGWSRATLHRWRKRYRADGPSGLCAKSRLTLRQALLHHIPDHTRPIRLPHAQQHLRARQDSPLNEKGDITALG